MVTLQVTHPARSVMRACLPDTLSTMTRILPILPDSSIARLKRGMAVLLYCNRPVPSLKKKRGCGYCDGLGTARRSARCGSRSPNAATRSGPSPQRHPGPYCYESTIGATCFIWHVLLFSEASPPAKSNTELVCYSETRAMRCERTETETETAGYDRAALPSWRMSVRRADVLPSWTSHQQLRDSPPPPLPLSHTRA